MTEFETWWDNEGSANPCKVGEDWVTAIGFKKEEAGDE